MTQVFFYHGASDKIAAACGLIRGVWAKRNALLIYAPEKSVADGVDRMLWTKAPLSFIPHCRANSPLAAETPILITDNLTTIAQSDRLMNLSNDLPAGYARFQTLVEVVGQAENDRQVARQRVHLYKEQGCEVRYFDLSDR